MKKISLLFITVSVVLALSSCKKWLDVLPNSQVKESELFKTQSGFKEALAGTYTILTDQALYGKELTYGMMGVLSHEWTSSPTSYTDDRNFNYTATSSQNRIKGIWDNMYKAISNVNNILGNVDESKGVFTGDNYAVIKGEALALRALLHFDLLRCFGQSYMLNKAQPAIPYVTKYAAQQTVQSTVEEVAAKILADLLAAKELLKVDPVFTGRSVAEFEDNGYLINRQLHLNYYAVEGLLARLYLYMGNFAQARISAQAVINSGKFSFSTQKNIIDKVDLSGAPEHLFALQIVNLTQYSINNLSEEGETIFRLNEESLARYFPGGSDDYRFQYLYAFGTGTNTANRYLLKFAEPASTATTYYRNKMPVLKLAEIYFILAECDNHDKVSVLPHINPVIKARGNQELTTAPADFRSYMTFEYRKEFIGEGQLFYYFKWLNQATIPDSDKNLPAVKAYVFPLPPSEYESADRVDNR